MGLRNKNLISLILLIFLAFGCSNYNEMDKEFVGINNGRIQQYSKFLERDSSDAEWIEAFTPFCQAKNWPMDKCKQEVFDYRTKRFELLDKEVKEKEDATEQERQSRIKNGYEKDFRSEAFEHLMNYRYLLDSNTTIAENFKKHNYSVSKENCKFQGDKDGESEIYDGIACTVQNKKYSWFAVGVDVRDFKKTDLKKDKIIWIPSSINNDETSKQFEEITRVKWRDYLFTSSNVKMKTISDGNHYFNNVVSLFKKIIEEYGKQNTKFSDPKAAFSLNGLDEIMTCCLSVTMSDLNKKVMFNYSVDTSLFNEPPHEDIFFRVMDKDIFKNGLEEKLKVIFLEIYKDDLQSKSVTKLIVDRIKKELPHAWGGVSELSFLHSCSEKWKSEINLSKVAEKSLGFVNVIIELPCSSNLESENTQELTIKISNK